MAFNIPPKAFQSFSKKQVVDTLWRIAGQIDLSWTDQKKREASIKSFELYLDILEHHIQDNVVELAKKIQEIKASLDRENLQNILMLLERENQLNLRDDQFLISTEDTSEVKQKAAVEVHLILDNLRSSFNVGSLIRTSEALGVTQVHLCGYTATPDNSKTAKSALGADDWVPWKYWESTLECIEFLKQEGISLYAFETADESMNLKEVKPTYPCALLLGNERYGISSGTLSQVDYLVKIPLLGRKNSLNVGVCGAIGLHHFLGANNENITRGMGH
jgi:23S rRNA (guanosine2251-2'-O)-methyltransferase